MQVFEQLRIRLADRTQSSLRVTQDGGVEARYWKVDLIGAGAAAWSDTQDAGGLFRASTQEVCTELQSEALSPLLVPAPNCSLGVDGRDKWVPDPRAGTVGNDTATSRLRFLGVLMGASARAGAFMELDLPALVWKLLLGEVLRRADLGTVDERIVEFFDQLAVVETEAGWHALGPVRWRVRSASGRLVPV
eukprot:SAG22_NODE_5802_length_950_cov_0.963572_1_plen_190_part_10